MGLFAAHCALHLQHMNSHHHIQAAGGQARPSSSSPPPVTILMAAFSHQVRDKRSKTRLDCFTLLTSLVTVLPGALNDHMEIVLTTVLSDVSWEGWGGEVCVCVCV